MQVAAQCHQNTWQVFRNIIWMRVDKGAKSNDIGMLDHQWLRTKAIKVVDQSRIPANFLRWTSNWTFKSTVCWTQRQLRANGKLSCFQDCRWLFWDCWQSLVFSVNVGSKRLLKRSFETTSICIVIALLRFTRSSSWRARWMKLQWIRPPRTWPAFSRTSILWLVRHPKTTASILLIHSSLVNKVDMLWNTATWIRKLKQMIWWLLCIFDLIHAVVDYLEKFQGGGLGFPSQFGFDQGTSGFDERRQDLDRHERGRHARKGARTVISQLGLHFIAFMHAQMGQQPVIFRPGTPKIGGRIERNTVGHYNETLNII